MTASYHIKKECTKTPLLHEWRTEGSVLATVRSGSKRNGTSRLESAREDTRMSMVQRESVEGGSAAKEMREVHVESSTFTGSDRLNKGSTLKTCCLAFDDEMKQPFFQGKRIWSVSREGVVGRRWEHERVREYSHKSCMIQGDFLHIRFILYTTQTTTYSRRHVEYSSCAIA